MSENGSGGIGSRSAPGCVGWLLSIDGVGVHSGDYVDRPTGIEWCTCRVKISDIQINIFNFVNFLGWPSIIKIGIIFGQQIRKNIIDQIISNLRVEGIPTSSRSQHRWS